MEFINHFLYGDKRNQSKFYEAGTGHYKRREWRGLQDTLIDYFFWLRNWGNLILLVLKAPVPAVKAVFRYRWMWSLLISFGALDYSKEGLRKTPLKISNMNYNMVVRNLCSELLTLLTVKSEKAIFYDLNQVPTILKGIEGFKPICPVALAVYVPSIVDQKSPYTYIDVTETYGIPADVCPLPQAEAGSAIEDDIIVKGICGVSTNMPCDGSIMASSYVDRRLNMPMYPLTSPMRYNNPDAMEFMADDYKELIKFLEKHTGKKYNYENLKEAFEMVNKQNELLLKKWETNKTDTPVYVGMGAWLYRVWGFNVTGLSNHDFYKNDLKTLKLLEKAVKNKEKVHPKQRFRAIAWSTPCNYYGHLQAWLLNCWGVVTVFSMLGDSGYLSTMSLDTNEELLLAAANTTSRSTMRKQTNGGQENVLEELWEKCDEYNPDIVFLHDHLACKGMAGLITMFQEAADERDIKLCTVPQDLIDSRTISRRDMRDKINKFMFNVMKAEPIDPALVDFDDTQGH